MTAEAALVVRGRIATLAGERGFGWVDAIAVSGGLVVAAGSAADVEGLIGPRTRHLVVGPELVVLPGITDAHLHLANAALAARQVDLEGCATLADGLAVIRDRADMTASSGDVIQGGGWDPGRWGRWPTADDLDAAAPGRLVALWSHDRHAIWASRAVLDLAGIGAETVDPGGGTIRRDASGRPDGVLQESAVALVLDRLPVPDHVEEPIRTYASGLLALGIVGLHDPGDLEQPPFWLGLQAVRELADRGALPVRVHASVREPALERAIDAGWRTGASLTDDPAGRARMGWLKLFADGALGSRTAWLLQPYEGTSDDRGIAVTPPPRLAALSRRAAGAGIVPQIHAIGDAALRAALDALEPVAPAVGPMARIEHVQFADPRDVPRLARGRIAASVQPIHLRTDVDKARAAWGKRAEERAFLLRSLVEAGVVVAVGTDAPVEPVDPWPGIALAVTRTAPEWPDGRPFASREAIALDQAIRAATVGPCIVAGDPLGGRLVPGSPADFIAIPAAALSDPVRPGGALGTARPAFVALGGSIVHEA